MHPSSLLILAAAAPAGQPPVWTQFLPFLAIGVIFWFLLLRPQMKQQKEHKAKLESIKRGDEVLTGGGFIGKVMKVDENYVEVELAKGMQVKALKSTITDIIPPGGTKPAND
jgi:preprotein translocase subunit YajC